MIAQKLVESQVLYSPKFDLQRHDSTYYEVVLLIGNDKLNGVVDFTGQVFGYQNLRVLDGSICTWKFKVLNLSHSPLPHCLNLR